MLVVAFTLGASWRLAGTGARVSSFIRGTEESVLPVIGKVGGRVERVNGQHERIHRITGSATVRSAGA
jgi:hypothetical protein